MSNKITLPAGHDWKEVKSFSSSETTFECKKCGFILTIDNIDGSTNFDSESKECCCEDKNEENESEDSEPNEDDITTADHQKFYQYGQLVLEVDSESDYKVEVKNYMDKQQFWPNVWFISDHGNAHIIDLSE